VVVQLERRTHPTRPVAALEHVAAAQFQCLLSTVPQHTVGADHPEEDDVPTQTMVYMEYASPGVQCPGYRLPHQGQSAAEENASEGKGSVATAAPVATPEEGQDYSKFERTC